MEATERTTTAARHSVGVPKLLSLLKEDMDWIVMKCLEKDRTRRYDTANGIAQDIHRHLTDEPIVARPPSAAYKFQKAWRHNKLVFTAAMVVTIALVAGVGISTWQALRARQAERLAETARQQAIKAQINESRLREQAQTEELAARQRAYASDMNLVQQVLRVNNLGRAQNLLNRQNLPNVGQLPRVAISPTKPLLAIASTYGEPGKFTFSLRLAHHQPSIQRRPAVVRKMSGSGFR